jgi:hypothetical protein
LESLSKYDLEIHLVDHGTTYGPMLTLLQETNLPVHWRGDVMPRSLWEWPGLREIVGDRRYLVTDPDIVLDDKCPDDWVERLGRILDEPDAPPKVGMGLKIIDLPFTEMGLKVRRWEAHFWSHPRPDGNYNAPVDTTLALHEPLTKYSEFILGPSIRMGPPYLIRHLPWYDDWYIDEQIYYRERILPGSSHWSVRSW